MNTTNRDMGTHSHGEHGNGMKKPDHDSHKDMTPEEIQRMKQQKEDEESEDDNTE